MYDQELIVFKWLSIPLTPQLARKPIALTHNSKAGHPLQREKGLSCRCYSLAEAD